MQNCILCHSGARSNEDSSVGAGNTVQVDFDFYEFETVSAYRLIPLSLRQPADRHRDGIWGFAEVSELPKNAWHFQSARHFYERALGNYQFHNFEGMSGSPSIQKTISMDLLTNA